MQFAIQEEQFYESHQRVSSGSSLDLEFSVPVGEYADYTFLTIQEKQHDD